MNKRKEFNLVGMQKAKGKLGNNSRKPRYLVKTGVVTA
jgi:hypothetical protein